MKRNVKGFTHYSIKRNGDLYSDWKGEWKLVKPVLKNNGYISNILWSDDGIKHNKYRHLLVAEAFIPNPHNYTVVCHKDNNPLNCSVDNLYWGTPKTNVKQCISDNRFFYIGHHNKLNLSVDVESSIVKMYKEGVPRKDILSKYNISVGVFYDILRKHNVDLRKRNKTITQHV